MAEKPEIVRKTKFAQLQIRESEKQELINDFLPELKKETDGLIRSQSDVIRHLMNFYKKYKGSVKEQ